MPFVKKRKTHFKIYHLFSEVNYIKKGISEIRYSMIS